TVNVTGSPTVTRLGASTVTFTPRTCSRAAPANEPAMRPASSAKNTQLLVFRPSMPTAPTTDGTVATGRPSSARHPHGTAARAPASTGGTDPAPPSPSGSGCG